MARAACEKGKLAKTTELKKQFMSEAMEYIQRALDTPEGEKMFAVHKWSGF